MPRLALIAVLILLTTPLPGAGRELAPRPEVPARNFVSNLAVGHASVRFLTVWRDPVAVYGALSDAWGRRMAGKAFPIIESGRVAAIDVVGMELSFAVFWLDDAGTAHLTLLDLGGRVLSTRRLALPRAARIDAAWTGERFLVTVFRQALPANAGEAAILDRRGELLAGGIVLDREAVSSHIAVTRDGFLVFTSNARRSTAHELTPDGRVAQIHLGAPATFSAQALRNGDALVAWATRDGQLRSGVWKDHALHGDHAIASLRPGSVPIHFQRGSGQHLLAFDAVGEGIKTILLHDDGSPASGVRTVATRIGGTPPGAAGNGVLLIPYESGPSVSRSRVDSIAIRNDGTIMANDTLSIRPAAQSNVLIGAGAGSMLTVWNEATDEGTRIRAAAVGRDFEPEAARELAPSGSLRTRRLPWNGTEYLVVYHTNEAGLVALRVAYDGTLIGEPVPLGERMLFVDADVTWAGDRWAIVWTVPDDARVRYATVSGSVATPPLQFRVTEKILLQTSIAFDGSRVHLAWIEGEYPPFPTVVQGSAVFTTRLRRDGRIVDAAPLAIPASDPNGVRLAANADRVAAVVDERTRTVLHMMSAESRELRSTRTLYEWPAQSDVTWDGREFVAALGARGVRPFLAVVRLGADGTRTDAARGSVTLAHSDWRVSVASTPSFDAVVALQETDAESGPRAVIYAERELPRLDQVPPAAPRRRSTRP